MNRIVSMAAVMATSCSVASADVKVFDAFGGIGDFHVAANWSPPGIPNGDDRIVIPSGSWCFVDDDATVDTVEVERDAELIVNAGMRLTLLNNSNNIGGFPDNSMVDGLLEAQTFAGNHADLHFVNSHTVSGGVVQNRGRERR